MPLFLGVDLLGWADVSDCFSSFFLAIGKHVVDGGLVLPAVLILRVRESFRLVFHRSRSSSRLNVGIGRGFSLL